MKMETHTDTEFASRVRYVVSQIPPGRVMTYGQIAGICGNARAARIVGGIAHFDVSGLPWHRVVNRHGGLADGYPGGRRAQAEALEQEGVRANVDYQIPLDEFIWRPTI